MAGPGMTRRGDQLSKGGPPQPSLPALFPLLPATAGFGLLGAEFGREILAFLDDLLDAVAQHGAGVARRD
jgi:hypothetical protein